MKTLIMAIVAVGVIGLGVQSADADFAQSDVALGGSHSWGGGGSGDLGPDACKVVGAVRLGDGSATAGAAIVRPNQADSGMWTAVLPSGELFVGRVTALNCHRNGGGGPELNVADIEGVGWLNGESGYEFAATMRDHGDGPPDFLEDDLAITIVKGATVISAGGLVTSGGITITPLTSGSGGDGSGHHHTPSCRHGFGATVWA